MLSLMDGVENLTNRFALCCWSVPAAILVCRRTWSPCLPANYVQSHRGGFCCIGSRMDQASSLNDW